jgi:hypothetical protein
MSTATSLAVEQQQTGIRAGSYRDSSLAELPLDVRVRFERWRAPHWMSSLPFAESYCFPPAERVSYLTGANGEIEEACFYGENRWALGFRCISLTCLVQPGSKILRLLASHRPADLIRAPFLPASSLSHSPEDRSAVSFLPFGEDHSIELPVTASDYLRSLGSTTRKHLPYYLRRLKKEWGGDWRAEHASGSGIAKQSYLDVLALNRLRMDRKRKQSLWTDELAEHRWELVSEMGSLGMILHKDRVVAGTLSFVYGDEAFLVVIAHDPQHDRLNLGNICLWLTIEDLIARRFRRYQLLWGNSQYKEQFGAVEHPLYEMTLFTNTRAQKIWRAAELLKIDKFWRLSKSITGKMAWMFSAASGMYSSQDRSK